MSLQPQNAIQEAIARAEPVMPAGQRRILSKPASDFVQRPISWLWPRRIALGKLTLIAGDPGLGKSLVTADMAARVSTGGLWIDETECPQGSVFFISAEDDPEDTICPRLAAAEANLTRVRVHQGVSEIAPDGRPVLKTMALADDLPALIAEIRAIGDVRLIVIDPISAYLAGVDTHRNADVRAVLAMLGDAARETGAAVVAVTHLNKGQGAAKSRITGSIAFVAAARAAYLVAADSSNPDRRLFLPVKNNIGVDKTGHAFGIEDTIPGVPRVRWHPELISVSADSALEQSSQADEGSALDEAKDWLLAELAGGAVSSEEIKQRARAAGLSWSTVRRAKDVAGVTACKSGFTGKWVWTAPEDAQDSQDAHV